VSTKRRNINYGIVKFRVKTEYPKKKPEYTRKEIEWLYVGDTTEEVKSLPTVKTLISRISSKFNLKLNQKVEIISIKTEKNLGKTNYEI